MVFIILYNADVGWDWATNTAGVEGVCVCDESCVQATWTLNKTFKTVTVLLSPI